MASALWESLRGGNVLDFWKENGGAGKERKASEGFNNMPCATAVNTESQDLSLPFTTRYSLLSDARTHLSRKLWPVTSTKANAEFPKLNVNQRRNSGRWGCVVRLQRLCVTGVVVGSWNVAFHVMSQRNYPRWTKEWPQEADKKRDGDSHHFTHRSRWRVHHPRVKITTKVWSARQAPLNTAVNWLSSEMEDWRQISCTALQYPGPLFLAEAIWPWRSKEPLLYASQR